MTCFELANMGGEGVAEIGLALKVEWGPVFAGESREKAYQRGAVCHKSGHHSTTHHRRAAVGYR